MLKQACGLLLSYYNMLNTSGRILYGDKEFREWMDNALHY